MVQHIFCTGCVGYSASRHVDMDRTRGLDFDPSVPRVSGCPPIPQRIDVSAGSVPAPKPIFERKSTVCELFVLQALGRFQCVCGIRGKHSRANSVPSESLRLSD